MSLPYPYYAATLCKKLEQTYERILRSKMYGHTNGRTHRGEFKGPNRLRRGTKKHQVSIQQDHKSLKTGPNKPCWPLVGLFGIKNRFQIDPQIVKNRLKSGVELANNVVKLFFWSIRYVLKKIGSPPLNKICKGCQQFAFCYSVCAHYCTNFIKNGK